MVIMVIIMCMIFVKGGHPVMFMALVPNVLENLCGCLRPAVFRVFQLVFCSRTFRIMCAGPSFGFMMASNLIDQVVHDLAMTIIMMAMLHLNVMQSARRVEERVRDAGACMSVAQMVMVRMVGSLNTFFDFRIHILGHMVQIVKGAAEIAKQVLVTFHVMAMTAFVLVSVPVVHVNLCL